LAEDAVWGLLADCLGAGVPAVLLAVVDSVGSSPGKAGAKLALAADGRSAGTVGGGAVEHHVLEAARRFLHEPAPVPRLLRLQHDARSGGAYSGMACGGGQTVAMLPCQNHDLPAVLGVLDACAQQRPGLLRLSSAGLAFSLADAPSDRGFSQRGPNDWVYREGIGLAPLAYLIGGGHVSLALSAILALLDFQVAVLEERENLDTFMSNAHAHEKRRVDYAAVGAEIAEGSRSYAVVMTHAHSLDEKVLRQLLDKDLRYLGMLGSRRKAAAILGRLRRDFPQSLLAQVRAPVGLPIGSHTPAEIAVSIAAEMVAVRNGTLGEKREG